MRAPLLALLGLIVAASPALAARTQERSTGGAARAKVAAPAKPSGVARGAAPSRGHAAAPSRGQATVAGRGGRAAQAAAPARGGRTAHAAAPARGGRTTHAMSARGLSYAGSSMTTRRGAHYAVLQPGPVCRGGARNCRIYRVSAPAPMRWSQGLSPALNVQTSNCPAGTMATLATGHANIVRCMPI